MTGDSAELSSVTDSVAPRPFKMKISMSVLDALGIRLYSNVAAVLSELVANAWDADANLVEVNWTPHVVSIVDDGNGMTRDDLIDRFLTVGYSKRKTEGDTSSTYGRKFMGRKGIGKLSVFSVASVVEVHTRKNGIGSALRIELDDLRDSIEKDDSYEPETIPIDASLTADGTILRLSNLNSQRMSVTAAALRKRLARRFDVLTLTPPPDSVPATERSDSERATKHIAYLRTMAESDEEAERELSTSFTVTINGDQVTYSDRIDLDRLEYVWEFGDKEIIPDTALTRIKSRFRVDDSIGNGVDWTVSGWFGTSIKPKDLDADSDAGPLKGLIVLARGRPIQENIAGQLNFNRLFGNYLTGQIRADFLDDDDNDIATSDRQRLMEDDPRVVALAKFLRDTILAASEQWAKLRPAEKAQTTLQNRPEIQSWIDGLSSYQREPAKALIGTIETIEVPEQAEGLNAEDFKTRLYQSSILAFERLALREDTRVLEQLATLDLGVVMPILSELSSYENLLYADVIRARLEVIKSFSQDVDGNSLEKVLQKNIHENMWLLDPAWGPATGDVKIEERLRDMAAAEGSQIGVTENSLARMDLRYCNLQGRHVIVELKRPGVVTDVERLYEQGHKYLQGLNEVLAERNRSNESREVVFILGRSPSADLAPPQKSPEEYAHERLGILPGRILMYNELIASAQQQYQEYVDAQKDTSRIAGILQDLDQALSDSRRD